MMHPDTHATIAGDTVPLHDDLTPFSVAWPDAGDAIRCAVEVPSSLLYTNFESFFVFADLPHGKFRNDKIRRGPRLAPALPAGSTLEQAGGG